MDGEIKIKWPVFVLVIFSSLLHATWNFLARKVKGDLSVIFLSRTFSLLLILPASFLTSLLMDQLTLPNPIDWLFIFSSGILHLIYIVLLGFAYQLGDISVAYPIARGTGILLVALFSFFFLGQDPSVLGLVGISSMVIGVLSVGIDARNLIKLFSFRKHNQFRKLNGEQDGEQPITDVGAFQENEGKVTQEEELNSIGEDRFHEDLPLDDGSSQSILLLKVAGIAAVEGCAIAGYSLVDSIGSNRMNPFLYQGLYGVVLSLVWTPFMLLRKGQRKQCMESLFLRKKYVASVGPISYACYLAILFAFTLGGASYIVALRESSVVIGALLGFILLKERLTVQKGLGIVAIGCGLVFVKFA